MAERHIYTVNLTPAKRVSRNHRAGKAMRLLQQYVKQHSQVSDISISSAVNEYIWQRGAKRPPRSIEVQVVEDEGTAHVELADRELVLEPEQPEEPVAADTDLSDEELAEKNVDEVKDLVRDGAVDAEHALDIEYAGKNRKTLIEWLQNRVGEDEEPEDVSEDAEDVVEEPEVEDEDEASDAGAEDVSEETYDLGEEVLDVFRDGTISDGKEAAKDLGKQEFEKLLNFEEAHQNRKGMKQFLRSNMN